MLRDTASLRPFGWQKLTNTGNPIRACGVGRSTNERPAGSSMPDSPTELAFLGERTAGSQGPPQVGFAFERKSYVY